MKPQKVWKNKRVLWKADSNILILFTDNLSFLSIPFPSFPFLFSEILFQHLKTLSLWLSSFKLTIFTTQSLSCELLKSKEVQRGRERERLFTPIHLRLISKNNKKNTLSNFRNIRIHPQLSLPSLYLSVMEIRMIHWWLDKEPRRESEETRKWSEQGDFLPGKEEKERMVEHLR